MSETDSSNLPILDEDMIVELRELMEEDFEDLLDTFLRDMPLQLAKLEAAVADDDAEKLWRAAHPLKSSSGSIGAMLLSALAERMERYGRDGAAAKLKPLLVEIQAAAVQTRSAIQSLLL